MGSKITQTQRKEALAWWERKRILKIEEAEDIQYPCVFCYDACTCDECEVKKVCESEKSAHSNLVRHTEQSIPEIEKIIAEIKSAIKRAKKKKK